MSLFRSFERHNEEIKVHCSTECGLQFLVGRTFESERRRDDVQVGTIGSSTIGSSHDKDYIARMIKIRTYYEAKWVNVVSLQSFNYLYDLGLRKSWPR